MFNINIEQYKSNNKTFWAMRVKSLLVDLGGGIVCNQFVKNVNYLPLFKQTNVYTVGILLCKPLQ